MGALPMGALPVAAAGTAVSGKRQPCTAALKMPATRPAVQGARGHAQLTGALARVMGRHAALSMIVALGLYLLVVGLRSKLKRFVDPRGAS